MIIVYSLRKALTFSLPQAWLDERGIHPADVRVFRYEDEKWKRYPAASKIEGGEVASVVSSDCSEDSPGIWFCTGPQGTSVSLTACLACATDANTNPGGVNCPPGTYDNGQGQCVGRGDSELCPNGYSFDASTQCCAAGPNIPYPGCNPTSEYLTALHTCQPGSPPLGDSCGVVSVPLGSCRPPDGGGDHGGDPCKGLDMYACFDKQGVCTWNRATSQCVPVP